MGIESFSPFRKKLQNEVSRQEVPEPEPEVYSRAKVRLREIFDQKSDNGIEELCLEIEAFALVTQIDSKPIIATIKASVHEDVETFVEDVFKSIKPLIDKREENPKLIENVRRERILQAGENIKLSELLYYTVDFESSTAHLHVAPKGDMNFGSVIGSFRKGLKELAKHVQEDTRIKQVEAASWIVAKNPGLLEKAGFTNRGPINEELRREHFENEDRPVSWAQISREKLLELHLSPREDGGGS